MKPPHHVSGGAGRGLIIFLLIAALLGAAYVWFVLHWSYSSGERAGWVQKLSNKGVLCKTWEGELAMISMPGAAPEKFYFTVWEDNVAEQINKSMGKRVSLHYEEKYGLPTSCFGETRYFVTKVNVVEDMQLIPPIAPGAPPAQPPAPASPSPSTSSAPAAPGGSSAAPMPSEPPAMSPLPSPAPAPAPSAPRAP